MPPLIDLTGRVFGSLTVQFRVDLGRRQEAYWRCTCECGRELDVRGQVLRSRQRSCRPGGCTGNPEAGYAAAHARVRSERGPASCFACVDCANPAEEWSYGKRDPDELMDEFGRPYSLRPIYYAARCLPCHRRFDAQKEATQ